VRLRVVLGSLAVMCASPLLAVGDGDRVERRRGDAPLAELPVRVANAATAPLPIAADDERPPTAPVGAAPPAEVSISVDCGHDMCVVQEGLDVTVVAGERAGARRGELR
jgi:hypothetical protein